MSDQKIRAARFNDGDRSMCVLAREARKLLHITFIDGGEQYIVHRTVPLDEREHLRDLPGYTPAKLAKRFRALGRDRGITEAALAELRLALA